MLTASPRRSIRHGNPANGALPPGAAATFAAAVEGTDPAIPLERPTVFPPSTRVLVLRGTSRVLAIGRGGLRPAELFEATSRWALLALALGRRLVRFVGAGGCVWWLVRVDSVVSWRCRFRELLFGSRSQPME